MMESAALDETKDKELILRGVIKQDCLTHLMVDDYQREAMPLTALSSIIQALENGDALPDIELGMRGGRFKDKDGNFVLQDILYIIDGLQRVNAAIQILKTKPDVKIRLGATVHFNTTKEWERERFRVLNTLRSKVSPNVLLRNKREESSAVKMLFALSKGDRQFALYERIAWGQRMIKGDLIGALTFAKVTGVLHSHKAPTRRTSVNQLVPALDKALEVVGIQAMRKNVRGFFDLIDECWGIKRVQYREGAVYMRGTFLHVMARLISDHTDFWRGDGQEELFVEASLRRKIASFPIHDPAVTSLASSGGKSRDMLYMLMRDHINSGKRTKRLTSRTGDMVSLGTDDDDDAVVDNEE
ncbi:MAG: hypothetical protein KBC81_03570 [Candidatus Pacebacteria bacterium]|nr:hypothetical protein [Candidatus Paceibacterota bacterium]